MKDGYRYFVTYATGEDGLPITSNDPGYFRVPDFDGHPPRGLVDFWDGSDWMQSSVQPFSYYMDDVHGSGATVRELLDEKDVPRKPAFLPPYQVPAEGQPAAFLPPYQEKPNV